MNSSERNKQVFGLPVHLKVLRYAGRFRLGFKPEHVVIEPGNDLLDGLGELNERLQGRYRTLLAIQRDTLNFEDVDSWNDLDLHPLTIVVYQLPKMVETPEASGLLDVLVRNGLAVGINVIAATGSVDGVFKLDGAS